MFIDIEPPVVACFLFAISAIAEQPSAPRPVAAPLRDIELGQLNFLHTTDIHGWYAGHLREPSYSADYGDYISFAHHLRRRAEEEGNDLLLIDTGDRIEGNGLYDASHPKGKYTFDIFAQQNIDLLASGNHELYKKASSEDDYNILVPKFPDSYVASNLDIQDPKTGNFVPMARRYRRFTTKKQGIRIMAFGFLFDFTANYNNTRVKPVEQAVKEEWFQDAIRDKEIDLFVVIGHSALRGKEFDTIFKTIRSAQWDTPIQFFGGHLHIRDYKKFDSKAYGLASGRFMETVGFQSISGLSTGTKTDLRTTSSPSFARRYIDTNLYSYYHHTGLNETTFPTAHGRNVSAQITSARKQLNLGALYGCSPQVFWMSRAEYPSKDSIFTWLEEDVLPEAVNDTSRADKSRLITMNTGAVRFDIFKGPFTQDDLFIVYPFTNAFRYIKDVPYEKASKILAILNQGGPVIQEANEDLDFSLLAPPEQHYLLENNIPIAHDIELNAEFAKPVSQKQYHLTPSLKPDLVPGYTTTDDAGSDGDDTEHSQIPSYKVPNVIQASVRPSGTAHMTGDPETVDFVYMDFIQPYILLAFKFTGLDFEEKDTAVYMDGESFTPMLERWVKAHWTNDC